MFSMELSGLVGLCSSAVVRTCGLRFVHEPELLRVVVRSLLLVANFLVIEEPPSQ
jgi:hypothetical protein